MKCTYPTARGVVHILTFRVKIFKKFVLVIKIRVINACRFFLVKISKKWPPFETCSISGYRSLIIMLQIY